MISVLSCVGNLQNPVFRFKAIERQSWVICLSLGFLHFSWFGGLAPAILGIRKEPSRVGSTTTTSPPQLPLVWYLSIWLQLLSSTFCTIQITMRSRDAWSHPLTHFLMNPLNIYWAPAMFLALCQVLRIKRWIRNSHCPQGAHNILGKRDT